MQLSNSISQLELLKCPTNKPKITFIIPVYNSALYLEECLNSLLNQSIHKEIIIIDDGSSDSSLSIILEYQQKHPEILLIKQPNQGAAAARNKGIALATGEFISFIDSDDFLIGDISPLIQLGEHYLKQKKENSGYQDVVGH